MTRGGSRPGMSLAVGLPKPLTGDMRVDLGRRQGRVTEQLLDRPQVSATLEQMGCHGVSKSVGTQVGDIVDQCESAVDEPAHDPRVNSPAPVSDEQRRSRTGGRQPVPVGQPAVECANGRSPQRDGPLLVTLAEHAQEPPVVVDVAGVEPAEFRDPDAAGVEDLNDRQVALGRGPPARVVVRPHPLGQPLQELADLVGLQRGWQPPVDARRAEGPRRVSRKPARAVSPGEEGPDRRCPALKGGALGAGRMLVGQPSAQVVEVNCAEVVGADPGQVGEQAGQVTAVGTHGVPGQVALKIEVRAELVEDAGETLGDHGLGSVGHMHQSRRAIWTMQAATRARFV